MGVAAQRLRLVLEGVGLAVTVAMAWVWAIYGAAGIAFTVLFSTAVLGNLVMSVWAIWALRDDPTPMRPRPNPEIRLNL
jgi:fatty acid desaturase